MAFCQKVMTSFIVAKRWRGQVDKDHDYDAVHHEDDDAVCE
jgi:hypothetical protein